jgi:hypothetical protein
MWQIDKTKKKKKQMSEVEYRSLWKGRKTFTLRKEEIGLCIGVRITARRDDGVKGETQIEYCKELV